MRLLAQAGRHLEAHYLLYPNPWPKKRHVMRRWHAHPAFASLLELGGTLDLRVNWPLYAEEMSAGLHFAAHQMGLTLDVELAPWRPDPPVSRFEAKYAASGHALTRLVARWRPSAA